MARLRFRTHHLLCALGFRGRGYSPEFVENFQQLLDYLNDPNPEGDREIELVAGLDSICAKCPNHDGKICASEHKVSRLDSGHADALKLENGQVLTWSEVRKYLAERMTSEKFEKVCAPCAWKSMGYCRSALDKLKNPK